MFGNDHKQDVFDFELITPCHRYVEGITAWCVEKAHLAGLRFYWLPIPGDALIGRFRSVLATMFMENRLAPYLIFLDSDIVFEPGDLSRLFGHLKAGYDLIGGLYTVKTAAQMAHYGQVKLDGTVQEVRFLSTGFMGISRRLLERMVAELPLPLLNKDDHTRCYPFFEAGRAHIPDIPTPDIYISEDWDFCEKARKIGVVPYVDTSIHLGHQGTKTWTVKEWLEKKQLEASAPNMEAEKEKENVSTSQSI